MPGSSVLHYLPEFAQSHIHWVGDSIQPSLSLLFSSCFQFFPASGSFPISQLFASGGQSIGASASASVLTMNIQDSFPLGLTGLVSLQSKGVSKSSPAPQLESINRLVLSILYGPLSYLHMTTGKTIALTIWTFVGQELSLVFNTLPRFVIACLQRSKSVNFMASVSIRSDFGVQENKICLCFHISPFYLPWSDDWMPHSSFF